MFHMKQFCPGEFVIQEMDSQDNKKFLHSNSANSGVCNTSTLRSENNSCVSQGQSLSEDDKKNLHLESLSGENCFQEKESQLDRHDQSETATPGVSDVHQNLSKVDDSAVSLKVSCEITDIIYEIKEFIDKETITRTTDFENLLPKIVDGVYAPDGKIINRSKHNASSLHCSSVGVASATETSSPDSLQTREEQPSSKDFSGDILPSDKLLESNLGVENPKTSLGPMSDVHFPSVGLHLGAKSEMGHGDDNNELTKRGDQCPKESFGQEEIKMDKVCQSNVDTNGHNDGAVVKNEKNTSLQLYSDAAKCQPKPKANTFTKKDVVTVKSSGYGQNCIRKEVLPKNETEKLTGRIRNQVIKGMGNGSANKTKVEKSPKLSSAEENIAMTGKAKNIQKNLIDKKIQVPEKDAVAATKSAKSTSKENFILVKCDLEKSKARNSRQEKCDVTAEKRRNIDPSNTEEKDLSKLNDEDMEVTGETKSSTENLRTNETIQALEEDTAVTAKGKWILHTVPVGTARENCDKKTVLLLGSSGSGKSTLIRFIASCYMNIDVSNQDLLRTKLSVIDEHMERNGSKVTAYEFYPDEEGKEAITVIDTPGLNDTSERTDSQHIRNIDSILKMTVSQEIEIHAIGFVVQSHVSRMTASDKVIIDYITKYIKESSIPNIIPLVTFADNEKTPPVIRTLQDYPLDIKHFFIFNNSFLCSEENQENQEMDELYRKRGHRQWKKLIKMIKLMTPIKFTFTECDDKRGMINKSEEQQCKSDNKDLTTYDQNKRAECTKAEMDAAINEKVEMDAAINAKAEMDAGIKDKAEMDVALNELRKVVKEFIIMLDEINSCTPQLNELRECVWTKAKAAYLDSLCKCEPLDRWLYCFVKHFCSQEKISYNDRCVHVLSVAKSRRLIHFACGVLQNAELNFQSLESMIRGLWAPLKLVWRSQLNCLRVSLLQQVRENINSLLMEENVGDIMTVNEFLKIVKADTGCLYMSSPFFQHLLNSVN